MENQKIIAVPGKGNIAFPASMSDDEIATAIKKNALYDYNGKSTGEKLVRQAGLTGRDLIEGAADTAGIVYDPIAALVNYGAGTKIAPLHNQGIGLADSLGLPTPNPGLERGINETSKLLVGTGATIKGADATSKLVASPVARKALTSLAANPAQQAIASIGAGAGGNYAKENGADAGTQFAASLASGVGAPLVAGGINAGFNSLKNMMTSPSTVSGLATMKATGGGHNFGFVGDDPSAGLNAAKQEAMFKGQDLGFKMTPGQATGSRALQQLEAKLESQPMTSGTFNSIKANNQTALNKIAANAIGENSAVVDSTVLGKASDRLSNVYKMVANDKPRAIDPDSFLNNLAKVESDYEGLLPASLSENPLVKRLMGYAEKGDATGAQLQDLASKLGRAATNNMTSAGGDRQVGMALFDVKNHVDDLLEQGLKGETLNAFKDARKQYRNLMLLTQRQGVLNPSSGDVSGNALASILQSKDRNGFLLGKNQSDLYNAARFAQAFKPIVGDSGTATRMPLQSATDFLLKLPFNVVTKAYTSQPAINLLTKANTLSKNGMTPPIWPLLMAPGLLSTSE